MTTVSPKPPLPHLFTPAGDAALRAVVARRPLLAFDFDGTLAPIVERPENARIVPAIAQSLAALAQRLPVAIVTGRRVADVRPRLGFEPRFLVGNHGAEDGGDAAAAAEPEPEPEADAVAAGAGDGDGDGDGDGGARSATAIVAALDPLRARLRKRAAELAAAGVGVEDKGSSLALHYRLSAVPERAQALIADALAPSDDAWRVFGGKMVVNVAARHAADKAQAVHRLLARCGAPCAVFAGDDVNDEPVFESALPGWLTIRVGRDSADAGHSRAMFGVDSPADIATLLQRLLALLTTGAAP